MPQDINAKNWKSSQLMSNLCYDINLYHDKDFKMVDMHSHDFYEIYFFVNGNASYIIEEGHYQLQEGDIMLISPNNLHQLNINDSSKVYERIVFWLNPRYIKKLSTQNTNLAECFNIFNKKKDYLIRDKEISAKIKDNLLDLYRCSSFIKPGNDIEIEIIIKYILLLLFRYSKDETKQNKEIETSYNPVISRTIDFINNHLNDNLSLDVISKEMYVSKYYLSRMFKQATNTTLHQYIVKKRLILSKKLIEQKLPIINIYRKCGFSDYSNFFRTFKKEYGITPKQYSSFLGL